MTRRRKLVFAAAAMILGLSLTSAALLAADLYVHHRTRNSGGLNRWGYRGPVAPGKVPGEVRIVMVGGSTVFGYGGPWHDAAPALLEQQLRHAHPGAVIHVINLGYNNEGAFAALPTLEDYAYLDYDIVILYEGYNDRVGDHVPNTQVYRRQSVVFRLTGYSPILPYAFAEAARGLRAGGANSGDGKPEFRPGVAARTSAAAAETANAIGDLLSRQLERFSAAPSRTPLYGTECAAPWSHYCASMVRAVSFALTRGAKVLIATQPIYPGENALRVETSQQASLAAAIQKQFGTRPDVRFLDLSRAIDLSDQKYSYDTMHLGRDGNLRLAQLLKPAVEELAWP
jgi:hypothetical protein